MSVSADEIYAHSDEDHGMGDVDTLLVVAHEAAPPLHPAEGSFDHPAAWQNFKALLVIRPADDLDNELQVRGLVHQLEPVVGAVGGIDASPRASERGWCRGSPGRRRCRRSSD